MYCRMCGNKLGDSDHYCQVCGTPTGYKEAPAASGEAAGMDEEIVFNPPYENKPYFAEKDLRFTEEEPSVPEKGEEDLKEFIFGIEAEQNKETKKEIEIEKDTGRTESKKESEFNWNVHKFPKGGRKTEDIEFNWNMEEFSKQGKKEAAAAFEEELFQEIKDDANRVREQNIDRFFTFSTKNEEFQKLLDQEYEKFKMRFEPLTDNSAGQTIPEPAAPEISNEPEVPEINNEPEEPAQKDVRPSEPATKEDSAQEADLPVEEEATAETEQASETDSDDVVLAGEDLYTEPADKGVPEDVPEEKTEGESGPTAGKDPAQETEPATKEDSAQEADMPVEEEATAETEPVAGPESAAETEPAGEAAPVEQFGEGAQETGSEAVPGTEIVPDPETGIGTGPKAEHLSEMARARALFTAAPAGEEELVVTYEEEKPKKGVMQILLIVIAVILAIEIAILGIRYFAPESAAAKAVGTGQTQVVNTVSGLIDGIKEFFSGKDSGETMTTPDDSGDAAAGEDNTGNTEEEEEPPAGGMEKETPDPNPTADKDALVYSQLGNNINIQQVKANDALTYQTGRDYGLSDLNNSKPIENNIWQTPDKGEPVYYDSSVVGTIIAFDSKWIDYVNNGDKSALELLKKDSSAYRKAASFSGVGKIKETFKLLEIGEIRQGTHGFYVWAHEEMQITQNGTVTNKKYNWIYYLEPEDGKMKIVNYIRF